MEVFGPYTPEQSLAEICWLLQEIGYTQREYHDLIDLLREKHEKVKGYKPWLLHLGFGEFCIDVPLGSFLCRSTSRLKYQSHI